MSPFKSRAIAKVDEPAADPADLPTRAKAALDAAIAIDPETAALNKQLAEVSALRAKVEGELHAAKQRHSGMGDAVTLLLGGYISSSPVAVADEFAELKRRVAVADEAIRLTQERLGQRRLVVVADVWTAQLAEPVRQRGVKVALQLAALIGEVVAYEGTLDSLHEAGFRLPVQQSWRPLPIFVDACSESSDAIVTLREAAKVGLVTEVGIVEAASGSLVVQDALAFGARRRFVESIERGKAEAGRTAEAAAQARAERALAARAERESGRARRRLAETPAGLSHAIPE